MQSWSLTTHICRRHTVETAWASWALKRILQAERQQAFPEFTSSSFLRACNLDMLVPFPNIQTVLRVSLFRILLTRQEHRFLHDRMTVHRNRFLVNRTNRRTEFQFYWYYYSTRFGHPFCRSQQHKMYQSRCTDKNSWWWAERLPETCRIVIPIKLEFCASVGFIHTVSSHLLLHTPPTSY